METQGRDFLRQRTGRFFIKHIDYSSRVVDPEATDFRNFYILSQNKSHFAYVRTSTKMPKKSKEDGIFEK